MNRRDLFWAALGAALTPRSAKDRLVITPEATVPFKFSSAETYMLEFTPDIARMLSIPDRLMRRP